MRKLIKLAFFLLLTSTYMFGQSASQIRGAVKLAGGQPATGATIFLLRGNDSSLLKTAVSGTDGRFQFNVPPQQSYRISASYSGHETFTSPVFEVGDSILVLETISLRGGSSQLSAVTVTGRKPIIEQQFDKLIFNVNGNISTAGNSALELLEKAPGVFVDANGSISMGGRPGVLILIDGKRTHLSENDLAAYLRGLPASSIERIDLITNPSSQYEAAGTSGIIDIRLKKDNRYGYNGSASLAYLLGSASSANGSFNYNYRNRKLNLYALLSKSFDDLEGRQATERTYFNSDHSPAGGLRTSNQRAFEFNSNNVRIGADLFANKKTLIGVMATAVANKNMLDYHTRTDNYFAGTDSTNFALDRSLTIIHRNSVSGNFNIRKTVDSAGREWTLDLDYVRFNSKDDIELTANYYDKNQSPNLPFYNLIGDMNGKIDVAAGQFDLRLPKTLHGDLQLGWRSSVVWSDNALAFFDWSSGNPVPDLGKTNRFVYRENINAIYANHQYRKGKWSLQTGLRMESTNGRGKQYSNSQPVVRAYTQLFPNLFLGYEINKTYQTSLSLARRIDRPSYGQLNPFRFYGSPFGYTEGNPFLNPQLTTVAEWSNTFKRRYIVRLSYSKTSDVIGLVWGTDPANIRISAQRPVNLTSTRLYRLTVTVPVTRGRLNSFNNLIGTSAHYQGEAFNTVLNRSMPSFYLSSNNTIRISSTLNVEVNGWFRTAVLTAGGYQRSVPAGSVTMGVGKRILEGKGNLRFNVSDIFRTNVGHGFSTLTDFTLSVKQWNETRRATISFSYNFGKSGVAASRNRSTSADEERRRAGN